MKKIISLLSIIILLMISINLIMNQNNNRVTAIDGTVDIRDWDFNKKGVVNLDGDWEFYYNKFISPSEIDNIKEKSYLNVPEGLEKRLGETTGYMTLRLKVLADKDTVYGLRTELVTASKVYVNGVLQGGQGKIGKSLESEKAVALPVYSYFSSTDGVIDIVIQTSNYRMINPNIKYIVFGLKSQVMNKYLLGISIDLIIIGIFLALEVLFVSIYIYKEYKDKSYIYFALMCFLMQLRSLFLNERVIIQIFSNIPYELMSKVAALTYYLWIFIYTLFLKQHYKKISDKLIKFLSVFTGIFSIIVLFTDSIFYDRLALISQAIVTGIMIYHLIFLIKKAKEKEKDSYISLIGLLIFFVVGINDILINNIGISSIYSFQVGVAVVAFLQAYVLAVEYSWQNDKIEELKIENRRVHDKSRRDSLTGLYNRKYIEKILNNSIERYKEMGEVFTVLMIDIDHFKKINDTYGHLFGDKVILTVCDILRDNLRSLDYIGRYGGEEFFVVLSDTKRNSANEIAERIRSGVENYKWENDIKVTVSIGVYENNLYTSYECIENVDKFMYIAKNSGRNCVIDSLY